MKVFFLTLLLVATAHAGISTTGGITLVKEGGTGHSTASNLAIGKTAFAKDEIGALPHAISKLNDGLFGNSNSWIAGTQNSFVGINLGAVPVPVRCVAFGRDLAGGWMDRAIGLYELQYTTVANPNVTTPDASWTTIGTMNYQSAGGLNFTNPYLRHVFNLPTTVMATGVRLKVNATTAFDLTCVDELELYAEPFYEPAVLVEQGGMFATNNLAAGKVAFAKNQVLAAPHTTANVNDGAYGNGYSWLAGSGDTFIGINLGSTPVRLNRVAWGRDNTAAAGERCLGTYTLQYTTTPNPTAATPEESWITITTPINYAAIPFTGLFSAPARRHVWDFSTVQATGFRLKITSGGNFFDFVVMDELELYDSANSAPAPAALALVSGGKFYPAPGGTDAFAADMGVTTTRRITIRNGTAGTVPVSVALTGAQAASFTLNTAGLAATLPAGGTASFDVTHAATTLGVTKSATVRLTSDTTVIDVLLEATGQDISPPVIVTHENVLATTSTVAGMVVNYSPTTVTDAVDANPTVTYSPPSGSTFPYGMSEVTITATDAAGNASTSGFIVTVQIPAPQLIAQGYSFHTNNKAFGKTPFGNARHSIAPLNDGVYGVYYVNSMGPATVAFGINLGATPTAVNQVAWSQSNLPYAPRPFPSGEVPHFLEFTTEPNPGLHTPASAWLPIGSMNYSTLPQTGLFSMPWLRHLWSFSTVQATGIRLVVSVPIGRDYAIDELEIYDSATSHELNPPVIPAQPLVQVTMNTVSGTTVVNYPAVTAVDDTDPAPVVTFNPPSGSSFANGIHSVAITATDMHGNVSIGTMQVAVSLQQPVLLSQSGGFLSNNLASGKTAFGKDVNPAPPHAIANINNGTYGNPSSWLAGTADSFIGINLGATPVPVSKVAWGRDNTGQTSDRWSGIYVLQFTTTPNPDASTPESEWKNIRVLDYSSMAQTGNFTLPARRHLWAFSPVQATGIRLRVFSPNADVGLIAIDELEIYNETATETNPPVIATHADVTVLVSASGTDATVTYDPAVASDDSDPSPVVTYSHASGSVFPLGATQVTITATDASGNMATSTFYVHVTRPAPTLYQTGDGLQKPNFATTATAFAKDVIGAPPHSISKLNDGVYGNPASWIGGSASSFFGLNFGSTPKTVHRIVWGRDNTVPTADRWQGTYTIQITTVPNPSAATPETSWISYAALDYNELAAASSTFFPSRRHVWEIPPVSITGIRIKTRSTGSIIAIDEIEAYDGTEVEATPPVITPPANMNVAATTQSGVAVTFPSITVVDNIDPAPVVNASPASGSIFPLGNTTVTITATDAQGNTSAATFTVTVTLPTPMLVETSGQFDAPNLATAATAFAKDVIGAAPHAINKLNDGNYGNSSSWIGGSDTSFCGLSFGALPKTVRRIAFGRDNTLPTSDRWQGIYTLQITTVPNPNAATPDASWISYGTLDYSALAAASSAFLPSRRHVWEISPIAVTGIRIITQSTGQRIAIDEIEVYNRFGVEGTPPVLTLPGNRNVQASSLSGIAVTHIGVSATDNNDPAPVLSYYPANGSVLAPGLNTIAVSATDVLGNSTSGTFTVTVIPPAPTLLVTGDGFLRPNLATTATAFAQNVIGSAPHAIAKVNDGAYGNPSSWIGSTAASFIGLNFGATPVSINRIAFGRDNTGVETDRWQGTYTLQITTTPNPNANTPDSAWSSFATLDYNALAAAQSSFYPSRRHLWAIPQSSVTGIRIKTQSNGQTIAIDEVEAYSSSAVDGTPPFITSPGTVTVAATSLTGANVTYPNITIVDGMDPAPVISFSPVNGSFFPLGNSSVTITATDAQNNTSNATFTLNVVLTAALQQMLGTAASGNHGLTATAFAKDEVGVAPHSISKLNDGLGGNEKSWIAGSLDSFVGLNFGTNTRPVRYIAFGRDNTGAFSDRCLGLYTLQYTTVPSPDASTPDASWTTIATLDYNALSAAGPGFLPARRHVWKLIETMQVTGIRVKCFSTGQGIAIDELEAYDATFNGTTAPEIFPLNINATATSLQGTWVDSYPAPLVFGVTGSPAISYHPPAGSFFPLGNSTVTASVTVGAQVVSKTFTVTVAMPPLNGPHGVGQTMRNGNLALLGTAFAQNVADDGLHSIAKVNDGLYGDSYGWRAATNLSFVGISFGNTPRLVSSASWGRDNINHTFGEIAGDYTIQVTTVPNPDATTPDSTWVSLPQIQLPIDTVYIPPDQYRFSNPSQQREFHFPPMLITGFRLKINARTIWGISGGRVDTTGPIAIDEICLYGPEGTPHEQWKALHFGSYTPQTANLDDFDGDGIPNLLEYAFGTTPTSATAGPLGYSGNVITRGQPTTSATHAYYIRRKDHATAGITYTPTFSNNLTTWIPSVTAPTVVADDGTCEVLSVPFPANQTRQFFRVEVE